MVQIFFEINLSTVIFFFNMMLNCRDKQGYILLYIYLYIHEHAVFDSCLPHLFMSLVTTNCKLFVGKTMSFYSYWHLQFKFDQSLQ